MPWQAAESRTLLSPKAVWCAALCRQVRNQRAALNSNCACAKTAARPRSARKTRPPTRVEALWPFLAGGCTNALPPHDRDPTAHFNQRVPSGDMRCRGFVPGNAHTQRSSASDPRKSGQDLLTWPSAKKERAPGADPGGSEAYAATFARTAPGYGAGAASALAGAAGVAEGLATSAVKVGQVAERASEGNSAS